MAISRNPVNEGASFTKAQVGFVTSVTNRFVCNEAGGVRGVSAGQGVEPLGGFAARGPTQVEGVHDVVLRPAGAAFAQVGFHEVDLVHMPARAGVDGEGVGVVVEKPEVPGPGAGAGDGEVRALAAAGVGFQKAVRHKGFQQGFVAADADPQGAAVEAAGAAKPQL